ncbi:MAG: serine/threonine protein kinase [Pyrinomonadaceae bacterium MAG19_C2-C3]|nr:serine/threonine protein kinase [Pyrinomonadaceae bacterium MAG19_C2-C3]
MHRKISQSVLPAVSPPPNTSGDRVMNERVASGSRLDEMIVAHTIARGMNTDVLAVWHTTFRTPLVCKVLRLDVFGEQDLYAARRARKWRQLLRLEAAALKRFQHPGIVRLISDQTRNVIPYLLLEHVGGRTLRDCLRDEKRLPVDEAVRIVQHTGAALAHVHHQSFIHRDLKPSNIIMRDGRPVLLDFGVVWRWQTTSSTSTRRPPDRCGTPQYLAPEQVRREPLSPLTDIYGLGVLLYELITGTRPYPASKRTHERDLPLNVRYPQLEMTPPKLRDLRPDIPVKLAPVIMRAMHREPDKRFADIAELLIALDEFTAVKIYPNISGLKAGDAFISSLKPTQTG